MFVLRYNMLYKHDITKKLIVFSSYRFRQDTSPALLDHVNCLNSSYLVLLACSYTTVTVGDNYCNDLYDVVVSCCKLSMLAKPTFKNYTI